MICDRIREQIPDCLAGRLEPAAREKVIEHLELCSACRADVAELGVVWRGLDAMKEPEPSPELRVRFMETLRAYEEGYQDAQRREALKVPHRSWWTGFWPSHPAWQAAFSAVLVILGVAAGRYAMSPREAEHPAGQDMARLQGQVENLRQLVALSMMQQQSPSARMSGVTYAHQMTAPDPQVEQALLRTLRHDPNINVRLSAVDALAKFMSNPEMRRAMADAVFAQESPLVQVSIIDVLVQSNAIDAVPALKKLQVDQNADPNVRMRAEAAVKKLEVVQ
jgi:hypothetical protein